MAAEVGGEETRVRVMPRNRVELLKTAEYSGFSDILSCWNSELYLTGTPVFADNYFHLLVLLVICCRPTISRCNSHELSTFEFSVFQRFASAPNATWFRWFFDAGTQVLEESSDPDSGVVCVPGAALFVRDAGIRSRRGEGARSGSICQRSHASSSGDRRRGKAGHCRREVFLCGWQFES